jgi:hypothetical protein
MVGKRFCKFLPNSDAGGFLSDAGRNMAVRELLVRLLIDGAVEQLGFERCLVAFSTPPTVLLGMLFIRSGVTFSRRGVSRILVSKVSITSLLKRCSMAGLIALVEVIILIALVRRKRSLVSTNYMWCSSETYKGEEVRVLGC